VDRENILNDDGILIAWLDYVCEGENENCVRGRWEGRLFHIIPAHTDPRAEHVRIALSTYHYATRDEAVAALETSWETAITVDNRRDRDNEYYHNRPVKIKKGGDYR
jgi:hypothetical protein